MDKYRTIAEAYCRALELALVDPRDVEAWTDSVLIAEPNPHMAFIDASSAGGSPGKLLTALRDVPGVADPDACRRYLIGVMRRALESDPLVAKPIAHALFEMAQNGDVPGPDAGATMRRLEDAFDLAAQTIGDKETALRELREFLDRYGEAV